MNISLKLFYILALPTLMLLTSCKDRSYEDYYPSASAFYLALNPQGGYFGASSDLTEIWTVYSVATPWRFEDYDESWLTFSPVSGNSDADVTLTAAVNTSPTIRTTTARFVSPGDDYTTIKSVLITQEAASAYILPDDYEVAFSASAGEKRIGISSNIAWKALSNDDWLSVKASDDGNSIVIAASENLTGSTRTGRVYVNPTDDSYRVTTIISVTQLASVNPEISTSTLDVDYTGASYTLSVTSEVAWNATTTASWIQITPSEGQAGTTKLSLQVAPNSSTNDRTGYVSILIGGNEKARITVAQKGMFIKLTPNSLTFTADGQQQKLQVESNVAWKITEKPEWISASTYSGTGDAELTITAKENLSDTPRSGTLKMVDQGSSITAQVNIMQNTKYFSVTPTTIAEIGSRGSMHTLHISTDDQWKAASTSSWIQLSQKSGQGDIDVTMTIPDNPSLKGRSDTTTFTPTYAKPLRIITKQAGRYLKTDVTAINFYSKGGMSDVVTVSTDANYTVTSSVSWLTIHQTGNTFTATAKENTDDSDREGKITIAMTGLQSGESFKLEIPVTQKRFTPGISVDTFDSEKAWDIIISGKMTITLTGFTVEKSWD